jgi:hypothetical protein
MESCLVETIHYIIQVVVGYTFLLLHKVTHAIAFSYQLACHVLV